MKRINLNTNFKKGVLFLQAFFFAFCVFSQNIEDYLIEAAENNPDLKAQYLKYQSSLEKVKTKGVLPDPEVSFGYFIQPIETRTGPQRAQFGVKQMFPWLGTLSKEKEVYASLAKSDFELFEQKKKDLFLEVKKTWYELYEVKRKMELTHQQHELHYAMESILTQKMSTGGADMADVLELQIKIDHHGNMINTYEDKLEATTKAFNLLLNRPADTALTLPDSLNYKRQVIEKLQIKDSIFTQNRELKSLEHRQTAIKNRIDLSKKHGLPRIGLGLNYIVVSEREASAITDNGKDAILPTVNLQIPIFRKKYKAMVRENEFLYKSLESEYTGKQNALESRYEKLVASLRSHKRNIELYDKLIKKAKQAQEVEMSGFIGGDKGIEEVLDLLELMYEYQIKKVRSEREIMEIKAALKSLY